MILSNEIEFTMYLLKCTYYLEKSFLFIFLYSASFIKQNLYKSMWEVKFIAEAKSHLYCQRLTPSFVLNYIQKCQKSVQRQTTLASTALLQFVPLIYAPQ